MDINKDEIPEEFDMDLGNETFTLTFKYNTSFDFFTVDLKKATEVDSEPEELVMGEKLILNKPLFSDFTSFDFPAPTIIPMDLSGVEKRITFDNLNEKVFLYIDDDGYLQDE